MMNIPQLPFDADLLKWHHMQVSEQRQQQLI